MNFNILEIKQNSFKKFNIMPKLSIIYLLSYCNNTQIEIKKL